MSMADLNPVRKRLAPHHVIDRQVARLDVYLHDRLAIDLHLLMLVLLQLFM
jgi:hypothetical protein